MRVQRLPRRGPSRRVRIALIVAATILLVLLVSLRGIAGFYTDYLWFQEVGFTPVFRGLLGAKVVPALVFMAVFFVVLLVNLVIADRMAPRYPPAGPEEEFIERYREVIAPYAGRVRVGVSLLFALIAGAGVASRWQDWLLFRNSVRFGVKDPQFHRDVGFYVFQLPFLKFLFEWAFAALVIVFLVTAVAHYLNGGIRVRGPFERVSPSVKAHLSVLLAVIAIVRLFGYYLDRFNLNFSTRGVVHGASYTDVHVQLPAYTMLMAISVVAAALFIVNIWRRGWVLPVLAVGLWAFVSLVIGTIVPAFVQKVRVEPNEFVREKPYIARNIQATQAAFGLDKVQVRDYPYRDDLTAQDLTDNQATIRNARLWDPNFLDDTYRQLQRIKNFYNFGDVDIDRYMVNGQETQTVLSARELDLAELPSNTWVNRHLVFTHGYGIVVSPANSVNVNGEPDFLVKDIPPRSDTIKVDQPALYYGEAIGGYAIVGTTEKEFDYPKAESAEAVTTTYRGRGGVKLDSFLRRAAFLLRFGDWKFAFSNQLTPRSRVIFLRDIRARVEKAAPFLAYDRDPYPVIVGGRIKWVIDAYTATDRYPYAQAVVPSRLKSDSGLDTRINYVRNSVKAVIDAYDGTITYYTVDDTDPLLRAYRKAFPGLFTDGAKMPADLRAHLRYPEDLFKVQTDLYSTYHVTDPRAFYNRSDQWAVSADPGSGVLGFGTTQPSAAPTRTTVTGGGRPLSEVTPSGPRMDPYYLLMRLPGGRQEEFVLLQPFTPPARAELGNLLSFMVAKSDPADYGRLQVYVMPRGQQVFGPTQANAQINTTADISEKLTLLNREGSQVIQGSLQLIPIKDSILYVRPLYVQATQGQTRLPQLQFVIVFYAGKAAMASTLDGALAQVFQGFQAPAPQAGPAPVPSGLPPDVKALLDQASQAYQDAQAALGRGDLGGYQAAVNRMGQLLGQARDLQARESGATSTTQPVPRA